MNSPEIRENVSLKSFNTFGIDIKARKFLAVRSVKDLKEALNISECKDNHLILGGGSNILFRSDFEGYVIRNEILGKTVIEEDDDQVLLEIGAGENWHELVIFCIENGWGGIENLSLIPGTMGAAPMQNIGAYGVEIKDVFDSLSALEISTGELKQFTKDDCEFGYRTSIFKTSHKGKYIITHVRLLLSKNPVVNTSYGAISNTLLEMKVSNPGIEDVSEAVIKIRSSKLPDPAQIGNAGSFFKNPVVAEETFKAIQAKHPEVPFYPAGQGMIKIPAGWLIEKAGWKGKKVGNTGSHKDQALVLVNYGEATGAEIKALSDSIQEDILQKYGIQLEREVNVV